MSDLAVLDTSTIVLMVSDSSDATFKARRDAAELALEKLVQDRCTLVVPTPVVAELCRGGPGAQVARRLVDRLRGRIRWEDLDVDAANAAGEMRRAALMQRVPGDERGAVLYDALIAGIAHVRGARFLVTANERDFTRLLTSVKSGVEVLRADRLPTTGQLHMLHAQLPKP